jgi:hypothetical protein
VFARARDPAHAAELTRHGVTGCVAEALESSLQLGAMFLRDTREHRPEDVQHLVELLRDDCTAAGTQVPRGADSLSRNARAGGSVPPYPPPQHQDRPRERTGARAV